MSKIIYRNYSSFMPMMVWFFLLLWALPLSAKGETRGDRNEFEVTVKGQILDDEKLPLPGASVLVEGTTVGAVSDMDGNYQLTVPEGATLIFSYIGFTTKKILVGNQSTINVTLVSNISGLGEVVVIGFGTTTRADVTGAVVSAPLKDFAEAPNTNILQALSGSTPGVSIGQVSSAGEEPSIGIRGQTSLSGNQNPLIVLDGIIYRGNVSDLNPKDIQSVDVLKDASSKAIYGAQAANGVILITTKTGKSAVKPVVSYSGFISSQSPSTELTPLGRAAYLKSARDVDWQNGFLAPDYLNENPNWTLENNTGFSRPC